MFTMKFKLDGVVEQYKADLVAKGYTQTYGIDYQETFTLVEKMNSIQVILSLAANQGWPLLQLMLKMSFCMVTWKKKSNEASPWFSSFLL